jgi:hypothetical protein
MLPPMFKVKILNQDDIDNAGLTDCHRDILAQFQVRTVGDSITVALL